MRIAMIGTGYVGLISGACLADFGHDVTCIDKDEAKIAGLKRGEMPIFEPGLKQLIAANVAASRLRFTTEVGAAVAEADVAFIAVGTPSRKGDGHADLSYVRAAAAEIAPALRGFTVVATKSTVPVGTGDEIERIILDRNPRADVAVISNPEFLREGAAIEDFKRPDRILIGLDDERARHVMSEVYRPALFNQAPVIFTSRRTAELAKYAANSFLAMKVTFINEIADLCEAVYADVQGVAQAIGMDKRIGTKFLQAGPGYGGSCFPKDMLSLVKTGYDAGSPMRLVETTVSINEQRKRGMARKVIAACGGSVHGKKIGLLGLTFKPDTDDVREASSLAIIRALQDAGAKVQAFDPQGMESARSLVEDVTFGADSYAAAAGASALVLVTEWTAFHALDFVRLRDAMDDPVLVDLRNFYAPREMARHGFRYVGVGRPADADEPWIAVAAE